VRILLDESLPRGLKGLLEGIDVDVVTVPEQGWQSMKNGELLRLASDAFDVFVTADQNLEHQQDIASLPLAVVVLVARSNRLEAYVPLAKKLGEAAKAARPGTVTRVAA
jgi:predicted nuclease of predicted toxin-antitoxin system